MLYFIGHKKQKHYNQNNEIGFFMSTKNNSSCLDRILILVLLCALCGITITECQRSKMRYDMDKIKYDKFMDSIKKQKISETICKYQGR